MTTPDLIYTLIRPLVEKYAAIQADGNLSVTFAFLINRVHFLRDDNVTTMTLSRSRATFCEILATRVFRDIGNDLLKLTATLTTSWPVYSGADPLIISQAQEERDDDLENYVGNAIEMAILGKAKRFTKSSACQKVIDAIWSALNLELITSFSFLTLFILFIIAIEFNERNRLNAAELAFMIYALGFTLEKIAAMQEHGIKVYFKGTWNGFDLAFKFWARKLGVDFLALIACLMFPRLAFVTFKNNLLVLSLRAMIMQFSFLMLIAAFCFCGFLYALWTLGQDGPKYGPGLIAWWMLDLWFGLDASGFQNATEFHPVFGPLLMVTYACLSNTLLLTVLVSILSNTFASLNEDAAAEARFRKAVLTIEGAKADFLFSYQPPINLIALCIMLPASYLLSPRWFHKVNVFMIRLTSFPVLLTISLYERQCKAAGSENFYDTIAHMAEKVFDTLPRTLKRMTFFEGLAGADADIDAVFEIEEEFDSALDTGDVSDGLSFQQRRLSGGSSRRGRPNLTIASPVSPPRASARPRLDSMITRGFDGQTYSPLAQVYNPFLVDDEIIEEPGPTGHHSNLASAQSNISYNPMARRRLTSIQPALQKRPGISLTSQTTMTSQHGVPFRKFPTAGDKVVASSPEAITVRRSTSTERGTAVSHTEGDDHHVPEHTAALMKRMEDMEQRQQRIEMLLLDISQSLKDTKKE
ncbi:hypothetical protein CVT24_011914 [Panaeolus cyanescens]|uniref:Ion transport domain-containing protein n=1 Tax=Panaeolus cyanescens TaxID=181874 RepID=A0A409WDV7_9AGAR|nr:hypothetical protein CVT24_011914 [Panaeolus cyanescens]